MARSLAPRRPRVPESLYDFPRYHRFSLSSSNVQIRDGKRRNLTEVEQQKRESELKRMVDRRLARQEKRISEGAISQIVRQNALDNGGKELPKLSQE